MEQVTQVTSMFTSLNPLGLEDLCLRLPDTPDVWPLITLHISVPDEVYLLDACDAGTVRAGILNSFHHPFFAELVQGGCPLLGFYG